MNELTFFTANPPATPASSARRILCDGMMSDGDGVLVYDWTCKQIGKKRRTCNKSAKMANFICKIHSTTRRFIRKVRQTFESMTTFSEELQDASPITLPFPSNYMVPY